ncbi:MAG: hypothetical protein LUG15_08415 [Oscillospiraceae bacterium]|nr:hypothetical protein [Oscillospiraceae bacterium]
MGGTFDKTVGKEPPGTYINFEDTRDYAAGGAQGTAAAMISGGNSNQRSTKDYMLGKTPSEGVVVEAAALLYYLADYSFCGETTLSEL